MAMGERDNGQKDTLVGLNRVHLKPDAEDLNPKPCRCLGSACMAWRWHHETKYDDEYMSHRQQGYCGKAGKP